MKNNCIFCVRKQEDGIGGDADDRILKGHEYWWLALQPEVKRLKTKQAAGLLIPKHHVEVPSKLQPAETAELFAIYKDATQTLCESVGATYTCQETIGFNEGAEAGQTIQHAHVYVLPVAEEDSATLKVRGGIGGAFEALRAERLG